MRNVHGYYVPPFWQYKVKQMPDDLSSFALILKSYWMTRLMNPSRDFFSHFEEDLSHEKLLNIN